MIPCEFGKTTVASLITLEMSPQRIKPQDKNGRNSSIGVLNKLPKIKPIHAMVTPIEIVIQKGPRLDHLYLCRISE